MRVPLVDLQAQYRVIKEEVLAAIEDVLDGMHLNPGLNVEAFEAEFAAFCGTRTAVGVGSGTDALHLLMRTYGIGPGDEVITVAHTFVATAEAVVLAGATPVFVDVDPVTNTMDPARLEAAITPRTKAVLPVHLYGQTADMGGIWEVARPLGIKVIEDACQAHGAESLGQRAGTLGDAAAFSFYCGKNLGAYGEAGMIVTNDEEVADRLRMLRDHGSEQKYRHVMLGVNGRLDEVQAAVLRVKLRYLDGWNEARRRHAQAYAERLHGLDLGLPAEREGNRHAYHLYVIETADRDGLAGWLRSQQIGTGVHYPIPVHLHSPYAQYGGGQGSLPISETKAKRVLSLPMFPELTNEQIDYVASAVERYAATAARAA